MKTIARFVGVAMVLGLVAGAVAPAQAATTAELNAMIAQLQAQLSAMTGTSTTVTSATFTTDLTVGSRGAQVTALQNVLISKGFLAAVLTLVTSVRLHKLQ
jgi:peptidoglycan hydrolase-like protein with peptidoglycan-binding domain